MALPTSKMLPKTISKIKIISHSLAQRPLLQTIPDPVRFTSKISHYNRYYRFYNSHGKSIEHSLSSHVTYEKIELKTGPSLASSFAHERSHGAQPHLVSSRNAENYSQRKLCTLKTRGS